MGDINQSTGVEFAYTVKNVLVRGKWFIMYFKVGAELISSKLWPRGLKGIRGMFLRYLSVAESFQSRIIGFAD